MFGLVSSPSSTCSDERGRKTLNLRPNLSIVIMIITTNSIIIITTVIIMEHPVLKVHDHHDLELELVLERKPVLDRNQADTETHLLKINTYPQDDHHRRDLTIIMMITTMMRMLMTTLEILRCHQMFGERSKWKSHQQASISWRRGEKK